MSSAWPEVALGDLAEIMMGQAPPGHSYNNLGDGVGLIAGAGDFGPSGLHPKKYTTSPTRLSAAGDIVLSIRATIGPKVWSDGVYCLGRGVASLRPRPLLDRSYLWHCLSTSEQALAQKGRGATFLQVNSADLAGLRIPLPPIEEQRRIAAVLDQADELRAKRRGSLALMDSLNEAMFFDMFGDPVSNPRGFDRFHLGELLDRIDSGKSPQCLSRPAKNGEWGVLKLGAVSWGVYDEGENKALPEGVMPQTRDEVRRDDLLFARKNTRELVGACSLVHQTRSRLLLSDLVFRLVLREGAAVVPEYLHRLLSVPSKRRQIQLLAGGSAGSMPNISKSRLLRLEVEIPPLAEQRAFVSRLAAAREVRRKAASSLELLNSSFSSLQQRAFAGNL